MQIEAQFAVYPVREKELSPFIERSLEILENAGLPVERGPMSSITYRESSVIFKAFNEIVEEFSGKAQFVLVSIISNACPVNTRKEV